MFVVESILMARSCWSLGECGDSFECLNINTLARDVVDVNEWMRMTDSGHDMGRV